MRLLNKEDILSRDDLKKEELFIPEWEASVLISELSADARDEFEQFMVEQRDKVRPKQGQQTKGPGKKQGKPQVKKKVYVHEHQKRKPEGKYKKVSVKQHYRSTPE